MTTEQSLRDSLEEANHHLTNQQQVLKISGLPFTILLSNFSCGSISQPHLIVQDQVRTGQTEDGHA